jgi:uncharacterized membrane protein HdeD (DUF308 family)
LTCLVNLERFFIYLIKFMTMELKYYDKPWLPAFKGAFLIIFGIIAMLKIVGTIKSLGVLFAVLIAMTGILLIASGLRFEKSKSRYWTIISGIINLGFFLFLALNIKEGRSVIEAREGLMPVILIWLLFSAICEIVEAVILDSKKNAFMALFLINAILTLMFAYFLFIVTGNVTEQSIYYIGIMALAVGIVNVLSSYLLSRIKA